MEDDDSSSPDDPGPKKRQIILLFITAYLGYTITDTYFILWLVRAFGEGSVSLYNSIGAVTAVFLGIGIMKVLRRFEHVNEKVFVGALLYSMLELFLYIILNGSHSVFLLFAVFTLDNLALITYSAPIETLAIKLMGKEKNVEVGTIDTRSYIVAGVLGAGVAYLMYPSFVFILASSVIFKLTAGVMTLFMPHARNHDSIELLDILDPDLLRNLPMTVASEVFYLTSPAIVSAVIGGKNYGLYVILMEVVVFLSLPLFTRMKHLGVVSSFFALLTPFAPLVAMLPYYSMLNAMVLRMRDGIIDDWGVDDSVVGVNIEKVFGAVLAVPFVKLFGASVYVLSALLLLSAVTMAAVDKKYGVKNESVIAETA